jgi:integrase
MSVRKRKWMTSKGEQREAWVVDYVDHDGHRHIETFERKKEADAYAAKVKVDLKAGIHVAHSKSITVREAGNGWLIAAERRGLERATLKNYRESVDLHIVPLIGSMRLSEINAPAIRRFQDELHARGRSSETIRRVMIALGGIFADTYEQGQIGHNPVRNLKRRRHNTERRHRLKIGEDIPTLDEMRGIIAGAQDRWRPLLIVAAFTGLRTSELRGLRWSDVDGSKLHVRQRADRYNQIGPPKTHAGSRTVPFGSVVRNTLREWKLACPPSELDLVFPTSSGKVLPLSYPIAKALIPAQGANPKYTGFHCLRHFYASWCINSESDGGLGLPPKVVQERLGHSSITMTMDVYGHLFPTGDDTTKLDAAELRIVSNTNATQMQKA